MLEFAAMTDTEVNRWAAERDGLADWGKSFCNKDRALTAYLEWIGDISNSADAAIALLERWGLEWQKVYQAYLTDQNQIRFGYAVYIHCKHDFSHAYEITDTCKFPRALLNAACAAKEAIDEKLA